ncbi:MAG TPA: chemotaxis protein CheW [Sphingomonas sp.]|jgi:purine-binding chemotaxis protein CheW|uniref:chemotaxis protein CheW n=1 Tax=Sphingomonas sp. TaxID=28214 RepID=UPI002ED858BB
MDRLMLIVQMADEIVALPAGMVESVVEIEAMSAIPLAPPHVAGLAALRSRVVTIINPRSMLGQGAALAPPFSAVVVPIEGHPYGIVVDDVLDVLPADGPPSPTNGMASAAWGALADGTVVIQDRQYLLVDPARLVAGAAVPAPAR